MTLQMSPPPPPVSPPPPPASPPPPPPAQTWFTGLDPEHIGHIQTKGWDALEPGAAAIEAVKAHRQAEKFVGVPTNEIVRLPKAEDADGWTSVYRRLGAPADAKEYDFSAVKFDDDGLTTRFQDAFRATAAKLNMPKGMAEEFAKSVYKTIEDYGTAQTAETTAAIADERGKLVEQWGAEDGPRFRGNMQVADLAAEKLGVTAEVMEKLKDGMGGAAVAELFRKIGQGLGEDRMVRDPGAGGRDVMTRDQAVARRIELLGDGRPKTGDGEFQKKYLSGDTAARREIDALNRLIAGV